MDTPINKAHFYARKSLHYSGEEKTKYIEQAIEYFKKALTQSSYQKAVESIELQINYYEKQIKLLNLRKSLSQKTEKQQKITDKDESSDSLVPINEHVDKTTDIQLDLLKNLEDSYNIIEELNRLENTEISSQVSQLQNLNSHLNLMFHKLSISMEDVLRENVLLREQAVSDQKKTTICNTTDSEDFRNKSNNEIIEHRDSSDDSPEEIQELPPLELPTFNLDVLDD